MTDEKTVLHERALLGAVLQGSKDMPGLARVVAGSDFDDPRHEWIWQACLDVDLSGQPVSALLVYDALGAKASRLPNGHAYLTDLMQGPLPAQAEFFAEKVREASVVRQIVAMGARCQQLVHQPDTSAVEMIAQIQEWAGAIRAGRKSKRADLRALMELVTDIAENGEVRATPSPWPDLDKLIGGLHPGHLITPGARPGVGKSIFGANCATSVMRRGKRVAFISLEMTATEVVQRCVAEMHGIKLDQLRYGRDRMDEQAWRRMARANELIPGLPLDLYDQDNLTLSDIRALAYESKREAALQEQELGLIVVDYIQLIKARDPRLSRQLQIGETTRGLKALAKELEVPVIAPSQLNRDSEKRVGKAPSLADLREAGDIEQDSDLVILLHELEVEVDNRIEKTGDLDLIVAKWRHGPTGVVSLEKWGEYSRLITPARPNLQPIGV